MRSRLKKQPSSLSRCFKQSEYSGAWCHLLIQKLSCRHSCPCCLILAALHQGILDYIQGLGFCPLADLHTPAAAQQLLVCFSVFCAVFPLGSLCVVHIRSDRTL